MLPRTIPSPWAPPLKCQGIKTRLVPFLARTLRWSGEGRWVEPFLGSGAVALNLRPRAALLCDTNPHLVRFYEAIQAGHLTPEGVAHRLTREGDRIGREGDVAYRQIRDRFNAEGDPLDFLLLNRACFNGLVRFNARGAFNVPFCRKPDRFRPAFVTKVANQVGRARDAMAGRDWTFRVADWRETLAEVRADDFVYLDPPYLGRFADYYHRWDEAEASALAARAAALPCGMALSAWLRNRFRENPHLGAWDWTERATTEHFYHLGAREDLRHPMTEVLLVTPGFRVEGP